MNDPSSRLKPERHNTSRTATTASNTRSLEFPPIPALHRLTRFPLSNFHIAEIRQHLSKDHHLNIMILTITSILQTRKQTLIAHRILHRHPPSIMRSPLLIL